jgi:hypothetical protein
MLRFLDQNLFHRSGGPEMTQVNNTNGWAARSLAGAVRTWGSAQGLQTSTEPSSEGYTYAHVDPGGFSSEKADKKAAVSQGRAAADEAPAARNAFRDLFETNAAALAAIQANAPQDPARSQVSGRWGAVANKSDEPVTPTGSTKWSISIDGGQIRLGAAKQG